MRSHLRVPLLLVINITIAAALRYLGERGNSPSRRANPLILMVRAVEVHGGGYWGIAMPSRVVNVIVKPGFSQTFKFTVGPNAQFPHTFKPRLYRVDVKAVAFDETGPR